MFWAPESGTLKQAPCQDVLKITNIGEPPITSASWQRRLVPSPGILDIRSLWRRRGEHWRTLDSLKFWWFQILFKSAPFPSDDFLEFFVSSKRILCKFSRNPDLIVNYIQIWELLWFPSNFFVNSRESSVNSKRILMILIGFRPNLRTPLIPLEFLC